MRPCILDHHGRPVTSAYLYEGASGGRRMSSWGLSTASENAALYSSLSTLRARSRELERNEPLASGAVETWVANLISTGITPGRWVPDQPELSREISDLWKLWAPFADSAGVVSFYGLQVQIARSWIMSGEVLARKVLRPASDGLPVPLQIQVLEADHLDAMYNTINPETGNRVRMGIELDATGRRVAYHLFKDHPGEVFPGMESTTRVRVPAEEILHVYDPIRPGQLRGRPKLAPIIVGMHDLDQVQDAERVRRKTTAMFGGFITSETGEDAGTSGRVIGRDDGDDGNGSQVIAMEPGTFPVLPPGTDVKFSTPHDVSGSYIDWVDANKRDSAVGMGLTYEQFTGDLRRATFSSMRGGALEARRKFRMQQFMTIIHQFCRPVAAWWLDEAVLSGAVTIPGYNRKTRLRFHQVSWRPDGWEWINPLQEATAEKVAMRCGVRSRDEVISSHGGDPEQVDADQAAANKRADDLGLVHDSDPRATSAEGTAQDPPPAAADDDKGAA